MGTVGSAGSAGSSYPVHGAGSPAALPAAADAAIDHADIALEEVDETPRPATAEAAEEATDTQETEPPKGSSVWGFMKGAMKALVKYTPLVILAPACDLIGGCGWAERNIFDRGCGIARPPRPPSPPPTPGPGTPPPTAAPSAPENPNAVAVGPNLAAASGAALARPASAPAAITPRPPATPRPAALAACAPAAEENEAAAAHASVEDEDESAVLSDLAAAGDPAAARLSPRKSFERVDRNEDAAKEAALREAAEKERDIGGSIKARQAYAAYMAAKENNP